MHAVSDPTQPTQNSLQPLDTFPRRHIGPDPADQQAMLDLIGAQSLEDLTAQTVPASIRAQKPLNLPPAQSESEALATLRTIATKNKVNKSFLGMGYYGTITPPVILRNILENPGWYTQYTPYQAEISQGRLEALLNFQTMVTDLTALPMANSSMLDEATAAGEAMSMCHSLQPRPLSTSFVAEDVHPQTIAVIRSRAQMALASTVDRRQRRATSSTIPSPSPGSATRLPTAASSSNTPQRMAGLLITDYSPKQPTPKARR